MKRLFLILLTLVIGFAAGAAVGDLRARRRAADTVVRAEDAVREATQLRTERDALVAELAESRRAAIEREHDAEQARAALEARLTRMDQLVAAIVGTRHDFDVSPTPSRSPGDKEVSGSN